MRWLTLGPVDSPWKPQLYGIQTTVTSRSPIFSAFMRGVTRALTSSAPRADDTRTQSPVHVERLRERDRQLQHRFGDKLVEPGDIARRRTGTPVFGDGGRHQHVGEVVHRADRLMRGHTRILQHRVAVHVRVKDVFHRALDRLVHLRQRAVLRHVGHVARIARMLLVRIRVDGREETPDAFRAEVERALAVRRGRVRRSATGTSGHVVSRPAFRNSKKLQTMGFDPG